MQKHAGAKEGKATCRHEGKTTCGEKEGKQLGHIRVLG
jgi:hypothetical protein